MGTRSNRVVTAPSLLCTALIICFLVHSDGLKWIHKPPSDVAVQIGNNLTLRWYYAPENGENLSSSTITVNSTKAAVWASNKGSYDIYNKFKNTLDVIGKHNVTIIVHDAKTSADGEYCMEVSFVNNIGIDSEQKCTTAEMFDYPKIIYPRNSKNYTLNVSKSVELYCNATGRPTPVVEWTKSSNPFRVLFKSNFYQVQVNSSADEGFYICNATNKFGNDTRNFYLKVNYPPKINKDELDINATEEEHVTVNCMVDGSPLPDVKWLDMNNKVISNGSLLDFPNVKRQSTGYYKCIATNVLGKDSKTVYLNILYKPEMLSTTDKQRINKGSSITLHCNSTGNPVPDLVWTKSDNMTTELAKGRGRVTLDITNAMKSDAGDYFCNATNVIGKTSIKTRLIVQYKPEIIIKDKWVINATEREHVKVTCTVDGTPPPDVKWLDINNKVISNGSLLDFPNVKRQSTGYYKCIANNSLGKDNKTMYLNVFYKPEMLNTMDKQRINEGSNITLHCSSAGNPVPDLVWTKSDNMTNELAKGRGRVTLDITNAMKSDAGDYFCNATNGLGTTSMKTHLIVQYKPKLTLLVGNNSIIIEERLLLNCITQAIPPVKRYVFYQDDKIVANSSKSNYTKDRVESSDGGMYKCIPFNEVGEGEESNKVNITILEPPKFLAITLNTTVNETETITLWFNVSGNPPPRVKWTKDGNSSVIKMGPKYIIPNAKRSNAGVYKCTASNGVRKDISALIEVIVNYKPDSTSLVTASGNNSIVINETLVLYCRTHAVPPASKFVLFRNGGEINTSTVENFTLQRVSVNDEGTYSCIPWNILGSGMPSNNLSITILEPPSISSTSPMHYVNEGESVSLKCNATGRPFPKISWKKDDSSEVIKKGAMYTINNATRNATGTYTCTATNGVKNAAWDKTVVVVRYKPITNLITSTGKNMVMINETLKLICETKAVPEPTMFSFYRNNLWIGNSANNTFTIQRASTTDGGNYTCTAENTLGEGLKSPKLSIIISQEPSLFEKLSSITLNLTDTITLRCDATGVPLPTITWTKDGHFIGTGKVYNKSNAERCDAGIYRCTADNGVKEPAYAEATVAVNSLPEKPKIVNIASSVITVEVHWKQSTTNCSLNVTGYVVQARKKGSDDEWTECQKRRKDGNEWSCSFVDLESGTSYTLQIFAKNRVGLGKPAEEDFETKVAGDPAGSSDASKGGLSKQSYIIIGACAGGLLLLIIILVVYKKNRTTHEASFQTHIELNRPLDGGEQRISNDCETPNAFKGPMTESQETLEIIDTRVCNHKREDKQEVKEGEENKNNGKDKDEAENRGEDDNKEKDKDETKEAEEDKDKNESENVAV